MELQWEYPRMYFTWNESYEIKKLRKRKENVKEQLQKKSEYFMSV